MPLLLSPLRPDRPWSSFLADASWLSFVAPGDACWAAGAEGAGCGGCVSGELPFAQFRLLFRVSSCPFALSLPPRLWPLWWSFPRCLLSSPLDERPGGPVCEWFVSPRPLPGRVEAGSRVGGGDTGGFEVGGGFVGGGDEGVGVGVTVGAGLAPAGVDGGAGVGVGDGVGEGAGLEGFGLGFGFDVPGRGVEAGVPAAAPGSVDPRASRNEERDLVPEAPRRRAAGLGITAGGNSAAWAGVIRLGATGLPRDSGPVSNAARQR